MNHTYNMATTTFTTTIEPSLLQWLTEMAKQQHTTKRQLLESALREFKVNQTKSSMSQGFQRAAEDLEILELSEMGLNDFEDQINQLDS